MIEITRKRYVVIRNSDEIFCRLARNYQFKKISEIGDTAIKTYLSKTKAKSAVNASWHWDDSTMRVVEVSERICEVSESNELSCHVGDEKPNYTEGI